MKKNLWMKLKTVNVFFSISFFRFLQDFRFLESKRCFLSSRKINKENEGNCSIERRILFVEITELFVTVFTSSSSIEIYSMNSENLYPLLSFLDDSFFRS